MKYISFILLFLVSRTTGYCQQNLSYDLIWKSSEFRVETIEGLESMQDGLHYTALEESDAMGVRLVKYSYATGEETATLVTSRGLFGDSGRQIEGYQFSADERMLLIETEISPIYRWSTSCNYYVHDLAENKSFPLTDFSKGKQRLASFSPDGQKAAFVRGNNLFVVDLKSRQEIPITTDGQVNAIINGGSDWVYEEEFVLVKGYEWSPGSNRIAFYRFDESKVREAGMDLYGDLYPERTTFKYPKAGEANSIVSIHVAELGRLSVRRVDTGDDPDIYIPRIRWTTNNDRLCIMRLNRHQNHLEFLVTDLSRTEPFEISASAVFSEKSDTYIEISDHLFFPSDGKSFLWTSERDGYNHIWQFGWDGQTVRQVTSGTWDVTDVHGMDESKGLLYYSSSEQGAIGKHLYAVDLRKGKRTCLTPESGTHEVSFSKGMKYFILHHSTANTPPVITLHNSRGQLIRTLEDNQALRDRVARYQFAPKEFFRFANREGTELNAWMMKPQPFDPSRRYPVLVAIYGGPGSNTVTDAWGGRNYLWYQLLCQKGFIVVSCDPRGTQFRGRDFEHSTYMNLGKLETQDFLDLATHLGTLPFVDPARMGIQGWSYGGYMTSLCMTRGAGSYAAGIAVAPVTNWKYYDTVYTERYMRTPQENSGGYENNSPIHFAGQLEGKFLIVHGSADDNVHLQNTMDMVNALVSQNKSFDMFIYPNRHHGISGGNARLHLFRMMTEFLEEHLMGG